jgi:rSAM/selenodomain-associated transferase 1
VRSDLLAVQLLVLAKTPVAGRVKTRLCPPLTPQGAADVAAAAIADTLAAVRATPVARRVLVVDGPLTADGFDRQPQQEGPLDERLAAAYDDAVAAVDLPVLLIGMDTPQVTPALLEQAARALLTHDSVMGAAADGGWWALGLRRPDGALLQGIPTSRADTGRRQHARLVAAGLSVAQLPVLRDVDTIEDAQAVAAQAPDGHFAAALAAQLATEGTGW